MWLSELAQDQIACKWQNSGLLALILMFFPLPQIGRGGRALPHWALQLSMELVREKMYHWSFWLGWQEILMGPVHCKCVAIFDWEELFEVTVWLEWVFWDDIDRYTWISPRLWVMTIQPLNLSWTWDRWRSWKKRLTLSICCVTPGQIFPSLVLRVPFWQPNQSYLPCQLTVQEAVLL